MDYLRAALKPHERAPTPFYEYSRKFRGELNAIAFMNDFKTMKSAQAMFNLTETELNESQKNVQLIKLIFKKCFVWMKTICFFEMRARYIQTIRPPEALPMDEFFDFNPVSSEWMHKKCWELGLPLKKPRPYAHMQRIRKRTTEHPPAASTINWDNDCLQKTFSFIVTGSEFFGEHFLHLLRDQIRNNKERYANYFRPSETVEALLKRHNINVASRQADSNGAKTNAPPIRCDCCGCLELCAASDLLRTTIWYYDYRGNHNIDFGKKWMKFCPEQNASPSEALYIVNRGRHRGLEFEPLFDWATSAMAADGGASSITSDNQFVRILKDKAGKQLGMWLRIINSKIFHKYSRPNECNSRSRQKVFPRKVLQSVLSDTFGGFLRANFAISDPN